MKTHDQLVLWVEERKVEIARRLLPKCFTNEGWGPGEVDAWGDGSVDDHAGEPGRSAKPLPEWPGIKVQSVWEYQVLDSTGRGTPRIVGNVDIALLVMAPRIDVRHSGGMVRRREVEMYRAGAIYVEAKPRIDDLGALIRQVRRYQHYLGSGAVFAVVSPDDTYAELLRQQGIAFVSSSGQGALGI